MGGTIFILLFVSSILLALFSLHFLLLRIFYLPQALTNAILLVKYPSLFIPVLPKHIIMVNFFSVALTLQSI
jgi:hypothetical protein